MDGENTGTTVRNRCFCITEIYNEMGKIDLKNSRKPRIYRQNALSPGPNKESVNFEIVITNYEICGDFDLFES